MEIADVLRAEAESCRETASGPCGEYATSFWVAAIVLENLAKHLDPANSSEALPVSPSEASAGSLPPDDLPETSRQVDGGRPEPTPDAQTSLATDGHCQSEGGAS